MTGPVTADTEPQLGGHPDEHRRHLLSAAAGPEPDVLDGDTPAASDGDGLPPGRDLAEVAAARADLRRAEEALAAWSAEEWHPWAQRWRSVEAARAL